jgi:hypothetical protein
MENKGMQERMGQALNGGMFPAANPNIDEVIKKEDCIDGEAVAQEHIEMKVEPIKESDIFMKPVKNNVRLDVKPKNVKVKKQRDYSHLAKARAKGAEVRKAKAEARRLKKAEEKAEKDRIKAERRAATAERNRQRAKDRYYEKKKQAHKEPATKPVNIPVAPAGPALAPPIQQGMDFNTFANYMLKYENMKKRYKDAVDAQTAQKEKKRQEAIRKKDVKKEPAYHPANYPLAHLYNPHLRKNKTYF